MLGVFWESCSGNLGQSRGLVESILLLGDPEARRLRLPKRLSITMSEKGWLLRTYA